MIFIATWKKKMREKIKEYMNLRPEKCVSFVSKGQTYSIMPQQTNDLIIVITEYQIIGTQSA